MMGISDITQVGKSNIVPYIEGESPSERHSRRLSTNMAFANVILQWCDDNGILLYIKNNGHHWVFKKGDSIAEWWPSSAKLILDKLWDHGIHCHDYKQVMRLITDKWSLTRPNPSSVQTKVGE